MLAPLLPCRPAACLGSVWSGFDGDRSNTLIRPSVNTMCPRSVLAQPRRQAESGRCSVGGLLDRHRGTNSLAAISERGDGDDPRGVASVTPDELFQPNTCKLKKQNGSWLPRPVCSLNIVVSNNMLIIKMSSPNTLHVWLPQTMADCIISAQRDCRPWHYII